MSNLTWFGWLYFAVNGLAMLGIIWTIGEPRHPRTGAEAAATLVIWSITVWGLLNVGLTP